MAPKQAQLAPLGPPEPQPRIPQDCDITGFSGHLGKPPTLDLKNQKPDGEPEALALAPASLDLLCGLWQTPTAGIGVEEQSMAPHSPAEVLKLVLEPWCLSGDLGAIGPGVGLHRPLLFQPQQGCLEPHFILGSRQDLKKQNPLTLNRFCFSDYKRRSNNTFVGNRDHESPLVSLLGSDHYIIWILSSNLWRHVIANNCYL